MITIPKQELLDSLHYLMQAIRKKEFAQLYESNNVAQYNLDQRVQNAHYKLLLLGDEVSYNFSVHPKELLQEWNTFAQQEDLTPTQSNKIAFGDLVKKTLQYFEYIKSLPRPQRTSRDTDKWKQAPLNEEPRNVRTMNGEQIQSELKRLESLLQIAVQKLEEEKKKDKPNKEEITKLNAIIRFYQSRIRILNQDKAAHESDKKSEQEWAVRLTQSFLELDSKSSRLNYEVWAARIEYFVSIALMIAATIWFFQWYGGFYEALTTKDSPIHITTWISYLPYALPVTAYIAVMWILIVQKNRASKISISLSTRLANVHYLEGLMKLVNRLSLDSEIAVERINRIVEKMIDSYLRQLETSNVTEKKIEKIEKNEQEDVPQQKIFNELKKHLTHD